MLYQNGRSAAEAFLATWNFDAYVAGTRTGHVGELNVAAG